MKRTMPLLVLFLGLAVVRPGDAGTFHIPKDEPIASVRIPDNWQVQEQEEFVEATPTDGACRLLVWTVEGTKVAESMGEAIRYIKRNATVTVRHDTVGKREKSRLRNRDVTTIAWDALENGQPITIRCHAVPVADRKWMLIIVWGAEGGQKKHRQDLTSTLESLEGS